MLPTAEFAHQVDPERNPEAIASTIRQGLQPMGIDSLAVEVAIIDSSLDLQIRTNSAVDKEKLLTLVRGELQNLHIESVAKFRIHCWRNDEEIHEQHLLWTEQLMINSPRPLTKSPHRSVDDLRQAIAPDQRQAEPQLSKNSVLQQAINKIAPTHPKAKQHLAAIAPPEPESRAVASDLSGLSNPNTAIAPISTPRHNYGQYLLLALPIVVLGLGIGASVRALSFKANNIAVESAKPQPVTSPSQPVQVGATLAPRNEAGQKAPTRLEPSTNIALVSPSASPESLRDTSPAIRSDSSDRITLEKFNIVQQGMTVEDVEKIFGVAGRVIAETNDGKSVGMVYSWKNPEGSNAIIEFKDGQVVAKAQAGL
ncbi:MAG: hypothetical protein AUK48_03270 [Oscillatoriales cyanobacterium CG2_30_44_21]|nr:MAG: hypothetical protein AUK48_03270 [Oscillatoriales cyanobacterium CG2_30_44_21]